MSIEHEAVTMTFRAQIKRALFEWGAIGTSCLAAGCLIFWLVSVTTSRDFTMLVGLYGKVSASGGEITVCEFLESWDDVAWERANMTATSKSTGEWNLPGLRLWYLEFPNGSRWIASISLLLPATAASLLAVVSISLYRRACKELSSMPKPPADITIACPLDLPD